MIEQVLGIQVSAGSGRRLSFLTTREWYKHFLLEEDVEDCRLLPVAGFTRENITIVDPQAPGSDTHVVEPGFSVTADDVARLRDALGALAVAGRLVAFCGSLPPGLTVDQFSDLLRLCLDGGAQVAVDSSGDALRAGAELPLWLAKPNRQELSEWIGTPLQTHQQLLDAATVLAQRIRWVLLSVGAEGALLVDSHGSRQATLPLAAEKVIGTVGCGDVLVGGFLAGWQSAFPEVHDAADVALRRGIAAATFAATQLTPAIAASSVEESEKDVLISST